MESNSNSSRSLAVFLDTEFTDFAACDLISIGLRAESGEEFYGENLDFNRKLSSTFVQENIYPLLTPDVDGMRRYELSARLWEWLDDLDCDSIDIFVDYPSDWDLLIELLEGAHPKIASVMNIFVALETKCILSEASNPTLGGLQGRIGITRKIFYDEFMRHFQETGEKQHHAMSDARATCRGFTAAYRSLSQ